MHDLELFHFTFNVGVVDGQMISYSKEKNGRTSVEWKKVTPEVTDPVKLLSKTFKRYPMTKIYLEFTFKKG